jgi:soluble lytic murein transglycosylase-like protein
MGFDTLYSKGIEDGIQRDLADPRPAPAAGSFNAWSFIKSGAGGVPSGLLESMGSISDLLSGAAGALASTEPSASGMFGEQSDTERTSSLKAAGSLGKLSQFDTAGGNALRRKADTFAPDPATSSTADQVIHGLTRGLTKAVTDIAVAGPAAGAAAFGLDEGNTAAQRLSEKGIDPATAAKVGAVTGVASAIGAALPIGGSSVLSTIGLAAAGGPGTFMAQEALSRNILAAAGHKDEASLHDPLDPLGLALSAAIPGLFGAAHIKAQASRAAESARLANAVKQIESGGNRYGKDGALLTSPKGAQGEMQVMPGTATDPGFGVTPAANNSPEELARVGRDYLGAMTQRYGGDTDKALAAYNAGPGAVDKALKFGDDWKSHLPQETQDYIVKGNKVLGEHGVQTAATDPAVVDAARVKVTNEAMWRSLPDHPGVYVEVLRASDEVAAGRIPDVMPIDTRPTVTNKAGDVFYETRGGEERFHGTGRAIDSLSDEYAMSGDNRNIYGQGFYTTDAADIAAGYMKKGGRAAELYKVDHTDAKLFDMEQPLTPEHQAMMRQAMGDHFPTENYETGKPLTTAREIYNEYRQQSRENGLSRDDVQETFDSIRYNLENEGYRGFSHIGGEGTGNPTHAVKIFWSPEQDVKISRANINDYRQAPRRPPSEGTNTLPRPESVGIEEAKPTTQAKPAAGKGDNELPSPESQKVAALAEANPDLRVKLPGSDETVSVSEALANARQEAAHEANEVGLFQAALDCALSFGSGA